MSGLDEQDREEDEIKSLWHALDGILVLGKPYKLITGPSKVGRTEHDFTAGEKFRRESFSCYDGKKLYYYNVDNLDVVE
jgi:hypothetical protein